MKQSDKIELLIEAIYKLIASIGSVKLATANQREAVKFARDAIEKVRQWPNASRVARMT